MTRDDVFRWSQEARVVSGSEPVNITALQRFAKLVAAAEKELIAQWVESWGNDLTIKEIVEGIRTDGNGATRPLKHVTREEPL